MKERLNAVPSAPMTVRSTQAVKSPESAASANQGMRGPTSRRASMRPRFHQKITRSAAGSVAVTVFVRSASTNRSVARR